MLHNLRQRFSGLLESVRRFPATVAFLMATAVLTALAIGGEDNLTRYISACAVGAVSCAAFQTAYERFFSGVVRRICLMIFGLAVTFLFYLSIRTLSVNGPEFIVRSAVTAFALFIAFVWIGTVNGRYGFGDSFMAAFKALFQSLFFSGILFLGCIAIIAAIDRLIVRVDEDAYMHTANIVFVIIAPLIFLSLIPVYPGRGRPRTDSTLNQLALIEKRTGCPKFLEVLLSYIIIPLVSVFTVILLAYILLNIGGEFWTNNLLEPLLISYTIAVIVITVLTGKLENRFAVLFLKIFPKVLIPIAMFQVIASFMILADTGVTFGRYFVILYGVFAVFSGVALSLLPGKRSGIVALALIILSAVALIPPVDAFTVSRNSQIGALENTLNDNLMLRDGAVTPNGGIPDADKEKIIASVQYLESTQELDRVKWLPAGFSGYDDAKFFETFGFSRYMAATPQYQYVNVYYDLSDIMPVEGYDVFVQAYIPNPGKTPDSYDFEINGNIYGMFVESAEGENFIVVKNADGMELIRFDAQAVRSRFGAYPGDKNALTADEAEFAAENERVLLKIIVMNAGFSTETDSTDLNAQMLIFIDIK